MKLRLEKVPICNFSDISVNGRKKHGRLHDFLGEESDGK